MSKVITYTEQVYMTRFINLKVSISDKDYEHLKKGDINIDEIDSKYRETIEENETYYEHSSHQDELYINLDIGENNE